MENSTTVFISTLEKIITDAQTSLRVYCNLEGPIKFFDGNRFDQQMAEQAGFVFDSEVGCFDEIDENTGGVISHLGYHVTCITTGFQVFVNGDPFGKDKMIKLSKYH